MVMVMVMCVSGDSGTPERYFVCLCTGTGQRTRMVATGERARVVEPILFNALNSSHVICET